MKDDTHLPTDGIGGIPFDPLFADAPSPAYAAAVADKANGFVRKTRSVYTPERKVPKHVVGISPNPVTKSAIAVKRRRAVAEALASGEDTLAIILDTARWAIKKARKLEELCAGQETSATLSDVLRLREVATEAAYKAAPFIHAKLAPKVARGETGLLVNLIIEGSEG